METNAPQSDEIEISLFGPGYGESIVLHIGNKQWIVVDSCLHPKTHRPAPIQYLQDIDLNPAKTVKLIVVTHWHDDHIRGISTIFRECELAKLVISNALLKEEFLNLVSLYYGRPTTTTRSGVDEFEQIFQTLEARKEHNSPKNPPIHATADRLLYQDKSLRLTIHSLSPSDAAIQQAQMAFGSLISNAEDSQRRVPSLQKNHVSVVLWIQFNSQMILLGSDLENRGDPETGWEIIFKNSPVITGRKAEVFKVPHHGSANAHHDLVWSQLLKKNPYALLTPFKKGRSLLPTNEDIQRITQHTSDAFITAPPTISRKKWQNKVVREMVNSATRKIENTHSDWGQIRLRCHRDSWQCDLFGDARNLVDL